MPTSTGSMSRVTPKASRTPARISRARASRLAVLTAPGLTRASVCLDEMRAAPGPLGPPSLAGVALAEAGVLDQPGGRHLDVPVRGREVRHADVRVTPPHGLPGPACDGGELVRGEDRVGEERPGAAGIRISGIEHHALARAQLQHGRTGLAEGHPVAGGNAELGGELGIADGSGLGAGLGTGGEPERDRQHDEPPGGGAGRKRRALEETGPVAEPARRGRHLGDAALLAIVDAHAGDRVGYFLAVGADVLDRGGAGQTGNPG